jgi:hypothetical protein
MVGAVGFELTTTWSQTRCATRLRYAPNGALYSVRGRHRRRWQHQLLGDRNALLDVLLANELQR